MAKNDSLFLFHHGAIVLAGLAAIGTAVMLYTKKADFFYIAAGAAVIFFFFSAIGKILEVVFIHELENKQMRDTLSLMKRRQQEKEKGDRLNVEG